MRTIITTNFTEDLYETFEELTEYVEPADWIPSAEPNVYHAAFTNVSWYELDLSLDGEYTLYIVTD